MASVEERCRGALLGLQAGDRNGGPLEMALLLGTSVADRGSFDALDVGRRYLQWHAAGGPAVWDAGPTAGSVLAAAKGRPESLFAVAKAHDESKRGMTAGANTAHRVAPLALHGQLSSDDLAAAAAADAALTHASPLAAAASVAVALVLRGVLQGQAVKAAAAAAGRHAALAAPEVAPVRAVLLAAPEGMVNPGGFCVEALRAALHFACDAKSFEEGLCAAVAFAGPSNYCPVFVGALLGGRFGAAAVPPTLYSKSASHKDPEVYAKWRQLADALGARLAATWQPQLQLPEQLLGYVLSHLHAFLAAGPVAAVSKSYSDAAAGGALCAHLQERDLAAEEAVPLPLQPRRYGRQALLEPLARLRVEDLMAPAAPGAAAALKQFAGHAAGLSLEWLAHMAATEGRPQLLLWAWRRGAQVHALGIDARSALMIAASRNLPQTVRAALQCCEKEQVAGQYGTALHLAAFIGAAASVAELCAGGCDLEAVNGSFRQTPLLVACSRGHADVVTELLRCGADIAARDRDGLTATRLARSMNNPVVLEVLEGHQGA